MKNLAIEGKHIFVIKNNFSLINNCSFNIYESSIYGLIGPSGSGKTSLIRCIFGYYKIDSGLLYIYGKKPKDPELCIPGKNIGFMPQEISLINDLNPIEILIYFGRLAGLELSTIKSEMHHLITLFKLNSVSKRKISFLSGGEKRLVSFACALIHKPKLIVLDEPTAGCDPLLRKQLWNYLHNLKINHKSTIIITTHYIEEVNDADCVGFIREGCILIEKNPRVILDEFNVRTLEDALLVICKIKENENNKIHYNEHDDLNKSNGNNDNNNNNNYVYDRNTYVEDFYEKKRYDVNTDEYLRLLFIVCWKILITTKKNILKLFFFISLLVYGQGFLASYLIGRVPFDILLGVIDNDKSELSKLLLNKMQNDIIKLIHCNDIQECEMASENKAIHGFVIIDKDFSLEIIKRVYNNYDDIGEDTLRKSSVTFRFDKANSIVASTANVIIEKAIFEFISDLNVKLNNTLNRYQLIEIKALYENINSNDVWGNRDFIVPSFIVAISYSVAFMVSLMVIVEDKLSNLFEREYSTGVKLSHIIIGHTVCNIITSGLYIQLSVILFIIIFNLNIVKLSSYVLIFMFILFQSTLGICHGILFSMNVMPQFINYLGLAWVITSLTLSGVSWLPESFPYFIKLLRLIIPYSLVCDAMRAIINKKQDLSSSLVYDGLVFTLIHFSITFVLILISIKYKKL